jgi:hypothetical protein
MQRYCFFLIYAKKKSAETLFSLITEVQLPVFEFDDDGFVLGDLTADDGFG